jgi:hypothetical protein
MTEELDQSPRRGSKRGKQDPETTELWLWLTQTNYPMHTQPRLSGWHDHSRIL